MNYEDCNFDDLKSIALLYNMTDKTARSYQHKSVNQPPWRDPYALLNWYEVHYERKPGKKLRERVVILGPQMARWEREQAGEGSAAAEPVQVGGQLTEQTEIDEVVPVAGRRQLIMEILADVENAATVLSVAHEERKAYNRYKECVNVHDEQEFYKRWHDLNRLKREWAKTADAVELSFKLSQEWLRSEWETQWKELRTALDGRRMGMEVREALLEVADDPVEWRRVWDMEMERVVFRVVQGED